jgi:hypothetical protein
VGTAAPTVISLKSATGGVASDGNASFSVAGKYKGSFGGSDKGATSSVNAQTTESIATINAECGGAGVSSLNITAPTSGNPVTLQ